LVAAVAALALGLTACSSSGGDKSSNSGAASGGAKPSGASSSSSGSNSATAGTMGTGQLADCNTKPNDCNTGTAAPGGTIVYTIEKTVAGWNINFTNSNVFDVAEVMDGIMPVVFNAGPDLQPFLNTDLMVSAEQTNADPQTLVYKIQPDAVWSDGTPISFDDFKYMKDASDGTTCPKCGPSTTAGYSTIKSMTPSDNGKTVTVVMKTPFADWKSMFGTLMPAHIAAQHGDLKTAAGINASFQWFDKNVPTWSGGPMIISSYKKDTSITETPNPKYYGKTKSSLKTLVFRIITDQTQEAPALQNSEVDAIYPQPNTDLLQQVKSMQNTSYYIGKGLIWEHFNLNEKNQFLKDKALRTAIFTAISRKDIIARTIGQFVPGATPMGNHIYVPGQEGYTDNITSTGQGSGDLDAAKKVLTDAGYTGVGSSLKTKDGRTVTFRCTYSAGNAYRQTSCQTAQNTLKSLGINVTLKTTQDLSELGTGNFDMIVFAWVGTPYVVSGAQQIYEYNGGAYTAYTYNKNPQADSLINEAATSTDPQKIQTLMNQADKLLTADAFELPLYQKPTMLAINNKLVNVRDNATSVGPPYNVQNWGVKAS
jgi:peptide/nickel transport system substrate-binding protein